MTDMVLTLRVRPVSAVAELYGGVPEDAWRVVDGFDLPKACANSEFPATQLGVRLHRELFPVYGG